MVDAFRNEGTTEECVGGSWFFFSSRRRHTRCSRDWSSDVCSSDLDASPADRRRSRVAARRVAGARDYRLDDPSSVGTGVGGGRGRRADGIGQPRGTRGDRKSTRLNSSHGYISDSVFCFEKKKNKQH